MRTVHRLYHGSVLCGFSDKVPGEWPTGHVWVDWRDRETVLGPEQTDAWCFPCDLRAKDTSVVGRLFDNGSPLQKGTL